MQELIGKSLGKYRIVERLARGGMAEIYKAYQNNLDRYVAIKVMHAHLSSDPGFLARFEREAKSIAALHHPHIVQVLDYDIEEDMPYIVMELIDGISLKTQIKNLSRHGELVPLKKTVRIIREIGQALSYAHQQNLVHRDVKSSNVIVEGGEALKGRAVLTDFGLVKILASDEMTITILQGRGTALYTPLEQYGGDSGHTDARSDVYAFGATLYHLLTNTRPIEARELFLHPENLVPPRQLNPDISLRTERAILWAMSLHPEDRPQDVEAFRQALLGDWNPVTRPRAALPGPTLVDLVSSPAELTLIWISAGLVLLSLLFTLIR